MEIPSRQNQIGLESIRVRSCEPGASCRMPMNSALRRWKEDTAIDCLPQSVGLRTQVGQQVEARNCNWKPQSVRGVERGSTTESPVTTVIDSLDSYSLEGCYLDSAADRRSGCTHQRLHFHFPTLMAPRAVFPLGSAVASERYAPLPILRSSFPFPSPADSPFNREAPARLKSDFGFDSNLTGTGSQSGLRTHSLARVSHEKRNVDECPATRGKSDRHR